jgi:hypothetical protein
MQSQPQQQAVPGDPSMFIDVPVGRLDQLPGGEERTKTNP